MFLFVRLFAIPIDWICFRETLLEMRIALLFFRELPKLFQCKLLNYISIYNENGQEYVNNYTKKFRLQPKHNKSSLFLSFKILLF